MLDSTRGDGDLLGTRSCLRAERRDVAVCCTRRGQGVTDCLCIPAGAGLRAQVLRECHDGPLGGHFERAKMEWLVRRLDFWVGQDVDVVEYVRSCQTCQHTKAEHGGPRGLLHPAG